MSGWTNSFSLLAKHGQKLGDSLFSFLAASNPEAALEVDRDKLEDDLRAAALKLAEARRKSAEASAKHADLSAAIEGDKKAAAVLLAKFEKNEGVDEATLTQFTDNLEDMQARLPDVARDAQDAKELADSINEIVDMVKDRLENFDRQARQVTRELDRARAEKERQEVRAEQQQEVAALRNGVGGASSSALGALGKKAAQIKDEAEALRVVGDVKQAPLDRASAVEEARRIAAGTSTQSESAAERLRRLSGHA